MKDICDCSYFIVVFQAREYYSESDALTSLHIILLTFSGVRIPSSHSMVNIWDDLVLYIVKAFLLY